MALDEFAAKVKDVTGGELEIIVSSGGALGYKGPELLKVVRDGLVPLSDMLVSGVAGEEKIFQIVTLPFLALNFEEARLLNDTARPYFDKAAEKWGQKILFISPWPGAGLWTKRKVISAADMKGLKTRTYDKNGALVVEATGGTPYALPFSEVYSSLATGVIDSVITSTPTAVDAKFWEVLKYYQPLNITIATDMINVNLKAFDKLDKKNQDALVKAGREMEEIMWKKVAALDKEKEDLRTKNGMETVPASKELMKELNVITEKIRADWLKDASPDAKAMYDAFLNLADGSFYRVENTMKRLIRIIDGMSWVIGGLSGAMLCIGLALTSIEIVLRSFFSSTLFITEEYSGYLMCGLTFCGLGYTLREKGHIRMTFLHRIVAGRSRGYLDMICCAAGCIFCACLTGFTGEFFWDSIVTRSQSMQISETYLAIPSFLCRLGHWS